jgi:hypothetical protein
MQANRILHEVLERFRAGTITLEEAEREIDGLRIEAVGDMANLDLGRNLRCGIPEVVLAEGKGAAQLADIALAHARSSGRCLVSRISRSQHEILEDLTVFASLDGLRPLRLAADGEVRCRYDALALAPGDYQLDAAVHRTDGLAYDYWCDAARIRVTSAVAWPGIWAPRHRWEGDGPQWE